MSEQFNIEWSSKYGQEVTINRYTVPVVGAYHSQGHVVLDENDNPKLLSFVGVWIEGTSKLINVPPPCEGWEKVLEAYEDENLLCPIFFTYQQAKDWLDMLHSGKAPFFFFFNLSQAEVKRYRDGLWEAERVCHMKDSFIYSTEEEDEENEGTNTVLHWKNLTYLNNLSPQELRETVGYHFHLSNETLYRTSVNWQIEMIKAADKGDELAIDTAVSLGLFV